MHRRYRQIGVTRLGRVAAAAALVVGVATSVSACGPSSSTQSKLSKPTTVVARVGEPIAFASNTAGDVYFAERLTGRVRAIVGGSVADAPVAQVDISLEGQRGLLGMAIDRDNRVFVAYTEKFGERRIIVSRVNGSVEQIVWRGPASQDQANGGHIAFAADGALLLGIGELAARELEPSLGKPPDGLAAGRLLALDPTGRADQVPKVVSSGWHNPYAFVVRPDGSVWIADNAPNGTPERLARADRDGQPTQVVEFDEELIPTALATDANNDFVLCTLTGSALRQQAGSTKWSASITTAPCTRAVFAIPGTKRLLFSDETTIFEISR